jgi:hypothetical protein
MDPLRSSLPRCTPPPLLFCAAHLRRTGSRVPADRVIDDEAFCRACFRGRPISPAEKLLEQSESQKNFSTPTKQNRLARSESEKRSTDGIPASHRLTALETKLLNALQGILLNESMMLAAIHAYRIPVTGRKKKAATARRRGRSRRTWQIPLQPTPIALQAQPRESAYCRRNGIALRQEFANALLDSVC